MKVSTVIDKIDSGAVALPEFQRGYVWSRRQVRELVESLYHRFPVGSLLLWETATEGAPARGDAALQPGYVSLLLDGQQRITSLYGLIKGHPPSFFDGNERAFSELRFNVETEEFAFYAPVRMRDNPLWLDAGEVMRRGQAWAMARLAASLGEGEEAQVRSQRYLDRLSKLYLIREIDLHDEQITGADKTVDLVVDLFNRVNASGTKLSKGDLALAKVCASWPEARDEFKGRLAAWSGQGFDFKLEWFLRNVNAIVTGRAEFSALEDKEVDTARMREGVGQAERAIDAFLNLASSRLGLDHDRVLGGVGAIPAISSYLAGRDCRLPDGRTADRLLFWYVNCLLWGRYAGSTETVLNVDLQRVRPVSEDEDAAAPVDRLIEELERQRGDWRLSARDFEGWSRGARFYPLLYMLSRVAQARDLSSGLELRAHLLGRHAGLEVHHLFPKQLLYRHGYPRSQVNALANFAFLTLETNRSLGKRAPADYFAACEERQPGVLASQWIPQDPELWVPEQFPGFLAERRELLARAANSLLGDLRGGRRPEQIEASTIESGRAPVADAEDETAVIARIQDAMEERSLERGVRYLALVSPDGAVEQAILDLAWPDGLEFGGKPVALLLDEPEEVRAAARDHDFRFFTSEEELLAYAEQELLSSAA